MTQIDWKKLTEPFSPMDIEWRIGQAGKSGDKIWAKVLAYITNRAIMNRLDEVFSPANWQNQFIAGPQGGVLCGISVLIDGHWVTKWDGAENTEIEAVKGGISDSMKRAAVQWGIGRYLYNLDEGWAEVRDQRFEGSRYANCKIKANGKDEYVNFHWAPPSLPAWAVPKPEPKQQSAELSPERKEFNSWAGEQQVRGRLKKEEIVAAVTAANGDYIAARKSLEAKISTPA